VRADLRRPADQPGCVPIPRAHGGAPAVIPPVGVLTPPLPDRSNDASRPDLHLGVDPLK
jgi:hypothetical protein